MPAAIETRDLAKVFRKRRSIRDFVLHPFRDPGKVQALDGVGLEVKTGEIFGLLGPNGAGKTTLLKILSCLISPTNGQALVNGADVVAQPYRVKSSIGLVTSDERSFYWRLSGRENLHFFASLYNVPRSRIRARCQALLEKVQMAEKADQQFMEYSTGTKQRLAIARALLHDPPIIFMDEPTRSLDPAAAKHLRQFVSETLNRKEGKTILLATHNLPEAEELCSRLAILHLSRVRRMGTLREIRSWGSSRERYVLEVRGVPAPVLPRGGRMPGEAPGDSAGAHAGERAVGEAAPGRVPEAKAGDGLAFPGCRVEAGPPEGAGGEAGPGGGPGGPATILAEVEKGGDALTELLRRLIAAGGTIVSCSRREASLQEVFDLVAAEGAGEAAGREEASARLKEDPAEREWAR